jgi:hypothetical protein
MTTLEKTVQMKRKPAPSAGNGPPTGRKGKTEELSPKVAYTSKMEKGGKAKIDCKFPGLKGI